MPKGGDEGGGYQDTNRGPEIYPGRFTGSQDVAQALQYEYEQDMDSREASSVEGCRF